MIKNITSENAKSPFEDINQIPSAIKLAARLRELVVFIGAGVSALHKPPLWDGFANAMVDQLGVLKNLSFIEVEQLKAIPDPRRKASIAIDLAGDAKKY